MCKCGCSKEDSFCFLNLLLSDRNEDTAAEAFDEAGSGDGDSVTSESSSETGKSQDEGDKMASSSPSLDLSKPWVDISILEFDDPSLFMVRMQHTTVNFFSLV